MPHATVAEESQSTIPPDSVPYSRNVRAWNLRLPHERRVAGSLRIAPKRNRNIKMAIRGIIFDLDETLVHSRLDYDAIRRDLGFPEGVYILEALAEIPKGPRKEECRAILRRHELAGADAATLLPGVTELLEALDAQQLPHAILTRNSREAAGRVVKRLGLTCSPVLTRDDAPAKPDPTGLLRICEGWNVDPGDALFFGDFLLDLQTGRNAGMRTVLYCPGELPEFAADATFVVRDYNEVPALLQSLQ